MPRTCFKILDGIGLYPYEILTVYPLGTKQNFNLRVLKRVNNYFLIFKT